MPCLNEAETLAGYIEKARVGIERAGMRGEILVADNGSRDNSSKNRSEILRFAQDDISKRQRPGIISSRKPLKYSVSGMVGRTG